MATQPESVEQLFEAALDLEPCERAAFLDQHCGGDPDLQHAVEELLSEDERAGSLLERPPFDLAQECTAGPEDVTGGINPNEILSPPSVGRLQPNQILIDRFVIVRFIAKGGMGEVYEAADCLLQGAQVALKTILPDIADDPDLQHRFEQEVLLARKVNHSNLCPIYDIFHCHQPQPSFLFLTMKLLPGETLAARLRRTPSISIAEGLAITRQMVAGLAAIHGADIVHRDIKPNNIMLDGSGPDVRMCITDFGLARAYRAEASLSREKLVAGTPDYMAPELYQGQPPSQASDLFAFGVVLHQVFTGVKPAAVADSSSVAVSPRLNSSGAPPFCVQLIIGCLNRDPQRRCQAFQRALASLDSRYRSKQVWSRRRFAGTAAGALCILAGGVWWKRDQVEDVLEPLPSKRFVALLNWPKTSDVQVAPMLTSVLNAIKSELTRVETLDRDLFVISPEDLHVSVAEVTHLKEVCDPLGANLVLAASGLPGPKHFQLFLRLLDPSSGRPLREKKLTCDLAEVTSLPGKAVRAAAALLNLEPYLKEEGRAGQGTQSAAAFTAFQSAETLMKQPNDSGLDEAIVKYQQAAELDSRYAIAHARLALAYVRTYAIRRTPEALDLARANGEVSLALAPSLADGHLALASVFEQTGNQREALNEIARALSLDPSNAHTLVRQAQIYTRLSQWEDAEKTLHRVLREHPNYWLAYNELGFGLHGQARYREAIQAFRAASLAAPASSMALSNLGAEYLQIGEFTRGMDVLKRCMDLNPASDEAAADTSLALRCQGRSEEALPFARRAVQLNPALDINWLELADTYVSLRNHPGEAKDAYLRAAREAEQHLLTNPTDGPGWMLLDLYKVKSGSPQNAALFIERAESLGARDMDSQFLKARILELIGKREEALATLAACFRKGATELQLAPFPDMQSIQKDRRYLQLLGSGSNVRPRTNYHE